MERLRENAGAADIELTPAEIAEIDAKLDTLPMSQVFGGSRSLGLPTRNKNQVFKGHTAYRSVWPFF